ncbi:MAG TPA: UDP-glucose 4-epimerase GalE [Dehalococcoidia bacterium]|nr:UDP-glucose 4-epimerase GalE [Dehalococcoidia bacterium]
MHVLVLGGAGYIGSVTVEQLLNAGHRVTVFDDLSYGHREAIDERAAFVRGNALNRGELGAAFAEPVDAVVHFAAFIAVGESMQLPEAYFRNNVAATINLLDEMLASGVRRLVFSSTAALFGEPRYVPIDEQHPLEPINPYGESKLIVERMLRWYDERRGIKWVALRYFNASGASERFGEDHHPETHLIPIVLEVAEGKRDALPLFGNDYPTRDGTCVRDYVHVVDLAQAHVLALDYAAERSGQFNLGSGRGSTNLEVVEAARRVTGHPIPVVIEPRRPGDPPELVASSQLARSELGWRPDYDDIETIVASAWRWRQRHPRGYAAAAASGG